MRVPFADLSRMGTDERRAVERAIGRVLDSGWFILGREVEAFEREWAAYCGAEHCVAVASGTDALKIALRVVAPRRTEVLTVANSAPATVTAIVEAGHVPRYVDVGEDGLMDAVKVSEALSRMSRVSVVLPVHLYGRVCQMDRICHAVCNHGTLVVEDACQAHGATDRDGRVPGEFGDACAWSFYPSKNLGALGDAGAITFHKERHAETARCLRNYGQSERDVLIWSGYNSRMDEVQAAVLRARLAHFPAGASARQWAAEEYRKCVATFGVPLIAGGNCHIAAIRVPAEDRDRLQAALNRRGIATQVHYRVPAHRQSPFHDAVLLLPETERWCAEVLSLPCSNRITGEEVRAVRDALSIELRRLGTLRPKRRPRRSAVRA